MAVKLFNRPKRKVGEFKLFEDNEVKMYVCGLTVQDYAHISHAGTYAAFDMIKRYLNLVDVGSVTSAVDGFK